MQVLNSVFFRYGGHNRRNLYQGYIIIVIICKAFLIGVGQLLQGGGGVKAGKDLCAVFRGIGKSCNFGTQDKIVHTKQKTNKRNVCTTIIHKTITKTII